MPGSRSPGRGDGWIGVASGNIAETGLTKGRTISNQKAKGACAMRVFEGAWVKLDRAKSHIVELAKGIRSYGDLDHMYLYEEHDVETNQIHTKVKIDQPIPAELAAILGDALHNLRSALDILVYDASKDHPDFNPTTPAFPIGRDKTEYNSKADRHLQYAPQEVRDLVDTMMPYDTDEAWLWRLHNANIEDKHRLLIPVGSMVRSINPGISMEVPWQDEPIQAPQLFIRPAENQYPLEDGDVVFSRPADATGDNLQPEARIEIAFGNSQAFDGMRLLPTLETLTAEVEEAVKAFENLFSTNQD